MGNDTRSSGKNEDDENKSSQGMHTSGTEQKLRRSGRQTPSKNKTIPSPSSAIKSDQLINKTRTTPIKRKYDTPEKQQTPSPLRRSLRGNKQPTSESSEKGTTSNSNGSLNNTEKGSESVKGQEKRPNARSYRTLFFQQKKREDATGRQDKLPNSDETMAGADVADNIRTAEFPDILTNHETIDGIKLVMANKERSHKSATNDAFDIAAAKHNGISNNEVSHCAHNGDVRHDLSSETQRSEIDIQQHEFCSSGDKKSDPMICETFTPEGRSEVKVTDLRDRAINCNINAQRNRKRVHYDDTLSQGLDDEREEVVKKRKVTHNSISLPSLKHGSQGDKVGAHGEKGSNKYFISTGTLDNNVSQTSFASEDHANSSLQRGHITLPESEACMGKTEELKRRRDAQKNLLFILKPEISELCEVLLLKEDVNRMVVELLEYIMDNHHVDTESSTILQAFQLSLCWIASSLKEHNIDRKDSLAVAQQHLNFCCKEEEVQCIYTILLKKLRGNGSLTIAGCPINLKSKDTMDILGPSSSQLQVSQQRVKIEVEDLPMESIPEIRMAEIDTLEAVKVSEETPGEHLSSLPQSRDEEVQEIHRTCEEEKSKLDKEYQVESAVMRAIHSHHPSRANKMKTLEEMYKKKLKEQGLQMEIRLQNLKDKHIVTKNGEVNGTWPEEQHNSVEVISGSPEIVASVSSHVSAEQCIHDVVPSVLEVEDGKHVISEAHSSKASLRSCSRNSIRDKYIDETDALTSERVMVTGLGHQNEAGKIIGASECPGNSDLEEGEIVEDSHEGLEDRQAYPEQNKHSLVNSPSSQPVHPIPSEGLMRSDEIVVDSHEGLEDGQANPEQNEQFLVNSPSSQPVHPIPSEGLMSCSASSLRSVHLQAFPLPAECSDIVTLPGMHNNDAPAVASNFSLQEIVIAELQPTDDTPSAMPEVQAAVLSVQSSQQMPVIVSAVETNYEAPCSEPNVLLQPSSCADSPISTQNSNDQEVSVNEISVLRSSSKSADSPVSCHKLPLPCENGCQSSLPDPPVLPNQPNMHIDCDSAQCLRSCSDQPNLSPTNGMENLLRNEANVHNQNSETPTIDAPVLPNQPNIHVPCESAQHLRSCFDQPDLSPINEMENLLRNEENVDNQNSETPTTVPDNFVGHVNQSTIQPPTYSLSDEPPINTQGGTPPSHTRSMSANSDFSNRSIQTTAAAPTRRMPQITYCNPLQIELERIRRETEQTIKNHEEEMLHVRSNCVKEIEEALTKIRAKHETLLQDMEVQFLHKRQQLNDIHKKVYMNKMLAEAFRSKCMDPMVAAKQGLNQQLPQVQSRQCNWRRSYSDTPTVPLSTARQWNAVLPSPSSVNRPTRILQSTAAPSRGSIDTVQPSVVSLAATSQPMAPFIQHAQSLATLLSIPPTRPVLIDSITPPTINIQVENIMQAPAPHLQLLRPISMPPSGVTFPPHVSLNQHSSIDPLEKTSQLSSRPLTPLPLPETMGDMRALHNSAVGMLRDICNRSGAKPTDGAPLLMEPGSDTIHSDKDLFASGEKPNTQVTSTPAGVTTDILCLSDDD